MSCTENESGSFVVFFLPAVVGCLTILLARRWANSQVSGTSSTAVSRRRKIIKDPLVKRPLPPIATKMVAPGSKKSSVTKRASLPAEEDVNSSGKRVGRTRVPPAPTPAPTTDVKLADGPMPPKHIPFPFIPHDGPLLFETMTFVFTLIATGLQFLNLYRTAWWLPHSHTNQAMNFYLIDPHLVAFIVTIICRRFLLCVTLAVLKYFLAPKLMPHATIAARMFILGVVLGALAWCTYFMVLKYPILKIFFLCYPVVIYFLLFGFQSGPFLELNNSETPPMHCCSHDPQQVRAEVEVLRQDFNLRVKKILFNSIVGAYYSSFIPCCFAQSYLYYDVYASSQQTVFVWVGLFGRYASQLLSAAHCDVAHRSALHLGRWQLETNCTDGVYKPISAAVRVIMSAIISHSVTTVPTIQLYNVAQLYFHNYVTIHELLHVIQDDARLSDSLESV
ncbi:transmembrane protein 39A isoform X2 [Amyelois transitella]|uniref:transmembrane protein 39A isoform X2 n=1 Tax=Amyelois transitella TaxID=680683 RepID=UPI00298FA26F|nr:transmembrane protein 39A isoform X2 [Amyelois transitella]